MRWVHSLIGFCNIPTWEGLPYASLESECIDIVLNVSADHQICCVNYYILLCCLEAAYLLILGLHDAYFTYLVLFGSCHIQYICS